MASPDPTTPSRADLSMSFAMGRRRFLLAGSSVAAAAIAACSGNDDAASGGDGADGAADVTSAGAGPLAAPGADGLVDEATYQQRVDEYLAFATTEDHLSNPAGINAHLVRATRDPEHTWRIDEVSVESLKKVFDQIDAWEDTRDFRFMDLTWMLALGQGDTEMTQLPPDVVTAIEERMLANRYRHDDPLPEGRIDELWYWSENHRIINLANEYLAGQRFSDRTFAVTGLTGAEHLERSKGPLLEWIDERAQLGFFEWHSNVYMLKNITPLLMLAELAEDPEVVTAAGMALDLCLIDVAAHNHQGCYTAPRGRTYKKDKTSSLDEATFDTAKFVFDDTDEEYTSTSDTGVTYLCAAQRYRPPQLVVDVALDDSTSVVRERHGVAFDAAQPVSDDVEAPYGKDFSDPDNVLFWWSLGAVGMWPLAEVGIEMANEFDYWATPLFAEINLMAGLNDYDPDRVAQWVQEREAVINFGFLSEANTYAYRDPKVSMASVLDHRFGKMRDQVHAWQAAIDENAMVFTTHPVGGPEQSTEWGDDGQPGYWTGEASMPRSAQFERAAVHIYQPKWDESTDPLVWGVFAYSPYTHAYVPQDHFDEVRQSGNWTVAAKDGGYIALWSWRTPAFKEYDPTTVATNGMEKPFDLVAEGGPDNVWIVEVGNEDDDGDLDTFIESLTASEPEVERDADGFEVSYSSPSAGEVEFSSTGAFVVDGEEQPLDGHPRHASPWGTIEHLSRRYSLAAGGSTWSCDFETMQRTVA